MGEDAGEMSLSREGLVSIIVPVYNSAEYIGECVESVLAQTYSCYELIMIDDGSQDDSREICERMCEQDERIRFIRQEHKGVSAARNTGMREARGEYIFFLDSDDAIHPLLVEECVKQIKNGKAKLALCDFKRVNTWQLRRCLDRVSVKDDRIQWCLVEANEVEKWFHIDRPKAAFRVGGLFRSDAIQDYWFDEELTNGEDTLFMYQIVCEQIPITYSSCAWYYYRDHSRSITHDLEITAGKRYWKISQVIRDAEYEKEHLDHAKGWQELLLRQISDNYARIVQKRNKEAYELLKEQMTIEMKHPLFRKAYPSTKILFTVSYYCYPLYIILRKLADILWRN